MRIKQMEDRVEQRVDKARARIVVARYVIVFVLILLTIIVTAVLSDKPFGLAISMTLQLVTLFVAVWTSDLGRRLAWAMIVISVMVIGSILIWILTGNQWPARGASLVTMIALVMFMPVVIGRRLVANPKIDLETVMGAADVYLLFGLFFALVYGVVGEVIRTGTQSAATAFFYASRPVFSSDFLYYSFVTLCTLGYGDLTATTVLGRMLSVTEALIGQLYLVTVVALLVSNMGRTHRLRRTDGSVETVEETD